MTLGRSQAQEYVGGEGKKGRWRLKEIISLDTINAEDLDGIEIYSEQSTGFVDTNREVDMVSKMEHAKKQQRRVGAFTDEFKAGAVRLVLDEGKTTKSRVGGAMNLTIYAVTEPATEATALDLDETFGRILAIPSDEDELTQLGRLAGVPVSAFRHVVEKKSKVKLQAVTSVLNAVSAVLDAVNAHPKVAIQIEPHYADQDFVRDGVLVEQLKHFKALIEGLRNDGAKKVGFFAIF